MAAERPTQAGRSAFGSCCAMSLLGLCLTSALGGCLNPLTDDQPSRRPASADVGGGPRGPETENPGTSSGGPGDFLTDDGEDQPAPNTPPSSPAGQQPDAGVVELEADAGPDSGSSGAP